MTCDHGRSIDTDCRRCFYLYAAQRARVRADNSLISYLVAMALAVGGIMVVMAAVHAQR